MKLSPSLKGIAVSYAVAVAREAEAKNTVDKAKAEAEAIKAISLAGAYESGVISGKNAEARRQQERAFIATDEHCQDALAAVDDAMKKWIDALYEKTYQEAIYKFTRASMYNCDK